MARCTAPVRGHSSAAAAAAFQPVAIAVVIAAAATVMIVIRPTPRQAALAEVVEAVAEDPAAAQSPAGQNRGLPGTGTGSEKGENRAYLDVCPG